MTAKTITFDKIDFFTEGREEHEYFIGKVNVNRASELLQSQDLKVYLVTFYDGARTRLHYHDSEQMLIAHEGEGLVVLVKKINEGPEQDGKYTLDVEKVMELKAGECTIVPAGRLHWHGGKKDSKRFSHTSVLKSGNTIWL